MAVRHKEVVKEAPYTSRMMMVLVFLPMLMAGNMAPGGASHDASAGLIR